MRAVQRLGLTGFATTLLLCASAVPATADTINIFGVESGEFSTATGVFEFNSQTNTLTFTLTNTSAITEPGSTSTITAIGFDLPPRGFADATGLDGFTGSQAPSLSSDFDFSDGDLGAVPHGFGVPPAVVLDFGFITGTSFAGGNVNEGLLPGESASFTVTGAAFAGFTEEGIANSVFVRFQNVPVAAGSGGSDVGTPAPIPEPTSVLLLGAGLLGLARKVSRSRKP